MSTSEGDGEADPDATSSSNSLSQSDSESSSLAENHMSESPNPTANPTANYTASGERQMNHKVSNARIKKHAKKRARRYDKNYRDLFNSYVKEVKFPASEDPDRQLILSQLGASVWTAAEKDVFFHLLARKGRHDIKGIGSEMGSKSELEISQYIDILKKGLTGVELALTRQRFVKWPEYDAACELSVSCTSLLERAALTLQRTREKEVAKSQQSDLWLLTPTVNKWVESCLKGAGEGDSEIHQTLPAAAFLNLGRFHHLSKRFFMNSSDLESNWRSYAVQPRAPTITHSAFSDFHELTISVTKRLVHSALYFAMSRLKALDASDKPPSHSQYVLKRQDILAAIRVLGMSENHRSHWAGVARRLNLRVFERVNNVNASGKHYNYNEIEHLLSKSSRRRNKKNRTTLLKDDNAMGGKAMDDNIVDDNAMDDTAVGDTAVDDTVMGDTAMDDPEDELSDTQSASNSDIEFKTIDELSDSQSTSYSDIEPEITDESHGSEYSTNSQQEDDEPFDKEEQEAQARDDILEKEDQRQSLAEEARLLKLLGEDPGSNMDRVGKKRKLQMQAIPRKNRLDLVDWTSWTEYGAEWETLKTPVPEEAFRANRPLQKSEVLNESSSEDEEPPVINDMPGEDDISGESDIPGKGI